MQSNQWYSEFVEAGVCGAILKRESVLDGLQFLKPGHFYFSQYSEIYKASLNIRKSAEPLDIVILVEYLKSIGKLESVGGSYFVTGLPEQCPAPSNAPTYAKRIMELWKNRQMRIIGQRLSRGDDFDIAAELAKLGEDYEPEKNGGLGVIPEPMDFREMIEDQSPKPVDFIRGFLPPETLCGIIAAPGLGKTILALNIAIHLAAGRQWFNYEIPIKKRVLYLLAEGGYYQLRDRIQKMRKYSFSPPENSFYLYPVRPFNLAESLDFTLIENLLDSIQPDIFMLDTFVKIHNEDENDNMAMQRVIDTVRRFITNKNRSAFIIHHLSKAGSSRGASAIEGDLDTIMHLEWEDVENRTRKLVFSKIRHGEELPSMLLKLNPENLFFDRYLPAYESEYNNHILKMLQGTGPEGLPQAELLKRLSNHFKKSERAVRVWVKNLIAMGILICEGPGNAYRIILKTELNDDNIT